MEFQPNHRAALCFQNGGAEAYFCIKTKLKAFFGDKLFGSNMLLKSFADILLCNKNRFKYQRVTTKFGTPGTLYCGKCNSLPFQLLVISLSYHSLTKSCLAFNFVLGDLNLCCIRE